MKRTLFKLVSATVLLGSLVLTPVKAGAAGSGTFSLSPASGSKVKGSTFSITLYENSTNVSVVTANLSYSSEALQCTSVSGAGSFSGDIGSGCSNGMITISKYITPGAAGLNGSQPVATISFKTLASSGSGTVNLTSGQIASDGADTWNGGPVSANFNFTAPAPVTPAPAPAPAPTPNPAPVEKLFTVTITVEDYRGNSVKGATVIFNGKTVTTDKKGKASFSNVKAGTYSAQASSSNLSVTSKLTVNAKNKSTQNFLLSLPSPKAKKSSRVSLITTGGGALALIFAGGLLARRKNSLADSKKKAETQTAPLVPKTRDAKTKKSTSKKPTARKATKKAKK